MIPAAVKLLECDAIRNRCRGVSFSPVLRLAWPSANSVMTLPRCATATMQPGCCEFCIWNSIQLRRYPIASLSHGSMSPSPNSRMLNDGRVGPGLALADRKHVQRTRMPGEVYHAGKSNHRSDPI